MTPRLPAWILPLVGAVLLCACAHGLPPMKSREQVAQEAAARAPILQLQGQLSIKLQAFADQAAKGISLGFFFTGHEHIGQLELMTAMGSQFAQLHWNLDGAWLRDGQQEHFFYSLNDLSAQVLGEPLPLAALMHWAQGRPAPGIAPATDLGEHAFTQIGWRIDTREHAIGRLTAERAASPQQRGITLRVRLDPELP